MPWGVRLPHRWVRVVVRSRGSSVLNRIVPTFPNASRVVLAGASSGGYGAVFNWGQTQAMFGTVRVDVIDDSGPILPAAAVTAAAGNDIFNPTVRANWNTAAALPSGCSGCSTDMAALYGFYAGLFPTHRLALLNHSADATISALYSITGGHFTTALNSLITAQFTAPANLKSYVAAGNSHTFLFNVPPATPAGDALKTFLTKMLDDDPTWTNVSV